MTETVPAAAVQIAAAALGYETHGGPGCARAVVAALARRYAFVEHAEMAALRAVVDELRTIHREYRHLRVAYCATCCDPDTDRPLTYPCPTVRALDALPPADAKEARS